ncbi:hypothetical protein F4780DRAFT_372554 [Xylariomycetidae sp. FL0641]|nr:hypothetical protein F4780DRAFT_372554 [Xylariomycetidae sp. FL0641]
MTRGAASVWTALIRTHHITNRKKLSRVKKAAEHYSLPYVLVRAGGAPGIMYCEGPEQAAVSSWVRHVHGLRYKDFQCVQKPAVHDVKVPEDKRDPRFNEVASTADFGERMEERGLTSWWKAGMGYK